MSDTGQLHEYTVNIITHLETAHELAFIAQSHDRTVPSIAKDLQSIRNELQAIEEILTNADNLITALQSR